MLFSKQKILELCPANLRDNQALWAFKKTLEDLNVDRLADRYVFAAQTQQNPLSITGGIFKQHYFKTYTTLPADAYLMRIYVDTAQKTEERHDYTVAQCWVLSKTKGLFLVDQMRGKFEAPEIESKLISFWDKHKKNNYKTLGAQMIKVEDKSSGSSLIQVIKKNYLIPIEGIKRHRDKFFRVMGVIKYFDSGYVHLPSGQDWVYDYVDEFLKFTPLMTHKHDDQIDPTLDALEDMLVSKPNYYHPGIFD